MSRRRYISTTMSVDKRIAKLSDSAALLWTWMIPHAEEDATITGDVEELRWTVVPSRPHMDVDACLREIEAQGLIARRDGIVYFDTDSFYRYQSNIHSDKRADHSAIFSGEQRRTAENGGEERETARNAASFSLSSSPSFTRSRALADAPAPAGASEEDFEEWWAAYGRVGSKADADHLYCFWRKKGAERGDLLAAAVAYRAHCERTDCKIAHARTFLAKPPKGGRARWAEWAAGEDHGAMDVAGASHLSDVLAAGAEAFGLNGGPSDNGSSLDGRRGPTRPALGGAHAGGGLPPGQLARRE